MLIKTQHLLSGNELSSAEMLALIELAVRIKQQPMTWQETLKGQHLALLFDKPSLRTRFSFTAAIQQLGGHVIEALDSTRKRETPQDLMRVLQGYCNAVMIRTFDDSFVEQMTEVAQIPLINGLTDLYHPCQILADLLTLHERFATLQDLTLCYIGDGNNILHSLLLMAPKVGMRLHYCCPSGYGPNAMILKTAQQVGNSAQITAFDQPYEAVRNANAVYTDVWDSMGYAPRNPARFVGFQVNPALMRQANANAVFMHCMPMQRGQEVSETLPDAPCSVVFQQSENRLHAQKALLIALLERG